MGKGTRHIKSRPSERIGTREPKVSPVFVPLERNLDNEKGPWLLGVMPDPSGVREAFTLGINVDLLVDQ